MLSQLIERYIISRLYILTTTSRLKEKYIFKKHLGELYFLNRAVKAAEARRVRAPPVTLAAKQSFLLC